MLAAAIWKNTNHSYGSGTPESPASVGGQWLDTWLISPRKYGKSMYSTRTEAPGNGACGTNMMAR